MTCRTWQVATAAIVSLGLVASGTNNSRCATALRSLASYYTKEPGLLFAVRLAQGLCHAGKGLVTLSPYHPDKSVCRACQPRGSRAVDVRAGPRGR